MHHIHQKWVRSSSQESSQHHHNDGMNSHFFISICQICNRSTMMIVGRETESTVEMSTVDETSSDGNSLQEEVMDKLTIYRDDDIRLEEMSLWGNFSTTAIYKLNRVETLTHEAKDENAPRNALMLKRLRGDLHARSAHAAMKDLRSEVALLTKTLPEHPNVLRLRGVSWHFEESTEGFAVVEGVSETLAQSLHRWKTESLSERKGFFSSLQKASHLSAVDQAKRVEDIALGLASAMQFLRSHRVMYRVLQPDCIGLRRNGRQPVLINFTHARVLSKNKSLQDQVGSKHYWAKEVAQNKAYGHSADIYQFGLLLWELLTFERPYESAMSENELNEWLAYPGKHPNLKRVFSDRIKSLLKNSWTDDPTKRPSWATIKAWLRAEVDITRKAAERT